MGFREKILIFGLLPWLVALIVVFLITIPTISGIFEKMSDLNDKQTELENIKSQVKQKSNTKKIRSEIYDIKQSIRGFNLQFPEKDQMDTMYVDFEKAAKESKATILKITVAKDKKYKFAKDFFTGEASKKDKKSKKKAAKVKKQKDPFIVKSRTVKLQIIGSYQAITEMLYYLSNYYRFLSFSDIQIKIADVKNFNFMNPSTETNLDAIVTFSVFKLNKAEEEAVAEEAKDNSKKEIKEKTDEKEEEKK